jgi:phosphoribosyl 1,2-cyclic phosphodiesterase
MADNRIWGKTERLEGCGLSLRGYSRGSDRSCFLIPELKLFFDAGINACQPGLFVFVTHNHRDHCCGLPSFVAGHYEAGIRFPEIYVPIETVERFQDYMDASYHLCSNTDKESMVKIKPSSPGDEVIVNKKTGHYVRSYDLFHGIPTRGYGIHQRRTKLNPKYASLDKKELAELGRAKIPDMSIEEDYPLVSYVCDSTIEVFLHSPELLKYKHVIVECTFFCPGNIMKSKHIHWDNLRPFVEDNPDTNFILIHLSRRYTDEEIVAFGDSLPSNARVWQNY